MKRGHAVLISLVIGAAALFGIGAALHTTQLGRSSKQPKISTAEIAVRNRALNRTEANLRRILAQKPAAPAAMPAVGAPRIVFVRPKPRIVTIHRSHGDESEADGRGHEGEGFDD
jgi:hypothetical protein